MKKYICALILGTLIIACGSKDKGDKSSASQNKDVVKTIDGKKVYKQNCVIYHGADGKLGINDSKDLTLTTMDLEERIAIVTNGKGLMTPFSTLLSEEKINAVAEYTMTLK